MTDYEYSSAELLAARKALRDDERRAIERHPDNRAEIESDYAEQHAELDALVLDRTEMLSAHQSWIDRIGRDGPLPAQMMQLLLEVENDDDLYGVMREISNRFVAEAQPVPEPAIEPADLVASVDPNNAWSGFGDARAAARNPYMPEFVGDNHNDPLRQRAQPESPKTFTTSADGEAYRRNATQARTPEQVYADLSGDRSWHDRYKDDMKEHMKRDGLLKEVTPRGRTR